MREWIETTKRFLQWHLGWQNYEDFLIALVLVVVGSFLGAAALAYFFWTFAPFVWWVGLWGFIVLPWLTAGSLYYRSPRR